jgi:hypothetical protein
MRREWAARLVETLDSISLPQASVSSHLGSGQLWRAPAVSASVLVPSTTCCSVPSSCTMMVSGSLHSGHAASRVASAHCVMHAQLPGSPAKGSALVSSIPTHSARAGECTADGQALGFR